MGRTHLPPPKSGTVGEFLVSGLVKITTSSRPSEGAYVGESAPAPGGFTLE